MCKRSVPRFDLDIEIFFVHQNQSKIPRIVLRIWAAERSYGWLLLTPQPYAMAEISTSNSKFPAYLNPGQAQWSLVREWIHACDTEHRSVCAKRESSELKLHSFRVIDCETRDVIPAPARCEASDTGANSMLA